MEETRLLGIDFGLKRIGLALCDPLFTFAYAYKTISNDKNTWVNLSEIINENKIKKIILGLPGGEQNKMLIDKILDFKNKIEKKFYVEVITWNEDYTSAIAQERIIQSVVKKKKRKEKGLVDQNSAAVILQEYLDSI